jgi:hypothetical protein
MSMENALAAGQGGTEIAPVPPTGEVAPTSQSPAKPRPDEAYRRFAIEELALQLARGSKLLAHCEAIAKVSPADALGPVREAARLINANAQLAKALAQMAMVERRSKTIVETIQMPDPNIAGLNARFPKALESETMRAALEYGLRHLLKAEQEPLAIGSGI